MKLRASKRLADTVALAMQADPSIACARSEMGSHEGRSTLQMEALGFTKVDLKKLERLGFAVRGYTKNAWLPGDTLPNGEVVDKDKRYHGGGSTVRWILVGDAE